MSRRAYLVAGLLMTMAALAVRINNVITFPPLLGYDGFAHFAYIWYLAETGRVPLAHAGWEFFQPPLYYFLMACIWKLFGGVDAIVRLQIGTGLIAVLGIVPALVAGVFVRAYFPGKRMIHLLAFGLMLFLPMHLYSSAFIGNEGLTAVLCSVALLALWWLLERETWPRAILLGVGLGLAMLVKFTAAVVVAAAFATIALRALHERAFRRGIKTLSVVGVAMLILCGPFYLRNLSVYGTPFQMSRTQLFLQNAEDSQLQGERGLLEYVLFDPLIVTSPQWPRGMSLNRGRPPGESYNPITESVLTGLYANTWFDGFGGFALPPIAKSPIAKHAGQILLTLGLLPTAIILLGVWTACVRLRREGRDDTIVFMLVGFAAMWVVFVYGTLSVPTHAAIKATYFMPISVIFAFWFAMGLDRLARIDRAHLNRVAVVCGVLGVTSCVVFAHGLIVGHRWFDDIRRGGAYQNLYGIVHYAGGETSKARAHFETAAARGDAYAHENLAAFAFAEDDLTEALYRSRGAIQIYKSSKRIRNAANNRHFQVGHAEQLNTVAVIYARLGWIREAVMSARRALNLDMPVPEVSFNLGVLRLMQVLEMSDQNRQERMKLLARSDELFEESRELDPAFHQAVAMRGVVAAMRGRCRLAAERIHESEMLAENSRRLYPFETGPGDIHAAALIRRRRIDPLPSRLQPETALDECRRRAG